MCGIIGAFGDVNKIDNIFLKALNKLSHRGPDAKDTYKTDNVLLGHARLSIIDLSNDANQPMIDEETKNVIVFNGEIYNFQETRDFLSSKGVKFKTKSDTEVLLKGYRYFGIDILHRLRGMFAFCIYDKAKNSLFFARDRFGKKPFYYTFYKDIFIFGSEIKALLTFFDKIPTPDKESMPDFFRYLAPSFDKTMYEGIKKLPASCFGLLDKTGLSIKRYYNPLEYISKNYEDEEKILKDVEEKLIESIKLRLVSDVEVASLLSGGLDSSFVSAVYSKISKTPINTFSIGYDEYQVYDELSWAEKVSNYINSKHHPIVINSKDFMKALDETIYHLDEPINDPATIPTYILSSHIHKSGIKVALSGEGSDELFFGYDLYYKYLAFEDIKSLKPSTKDHMLNFLNTIQDSKDKELVKRALKDDIVFRSVGECFTDDELKNLLSFEYDSHTIGRFWKDFEDFKHHHISIWYYYLDMYMWLSEVLMMKIDKMSMAHSLELRAPMLDHRLHELVLNISPHIRISDQNKHILKKIAVKYLPQEIAYRRKKGFSYPFIEWLYKENKDMLKTWLEINHQHGFFKEEFLRFLYERGNSKAYKHHVWAIEIFSRWFKNTYLAN